MHKIGVVIPSYNQGLFIEEAIKSVLSQKKVEVKIALVDGGSTDNTIEIIEKYEQFFTYCRSYKDTGQSAAINEGMRFFNDCSYVCWLNSDDVLLDNCLSILSNQLEARPYAVAAYGKAQVIDGKGDFLRNYPTEVFNRKRFSRYCFICQPATLIKKECWDLVKGLDERLHMCLDYDLLWKLSSLGEISYVSEHIACSREHLNTKSLKNQQQHYKEAFDVLSRHYGRVPFVWVLSRVIHTYRSNRSSNSPLSAYRKFLLLVQASIQYLSIGLFRRKAGV